MLFMINLFALRVDAAEIFFFVRAGCYLVRTQSFVVSIPDSILMTTTTTTTNNYKLLPPCIRNENDAVAEKTIK